MLLLVFTFTGFLWYLRTTQQQPPMSIREFAAERGIGGAPNEITVIPTTIPQENIFFAPMQGMEQGGAATLVGENGRTKVTITVASIPDLDSPQPAHIHTGTCREVGNIVYPLNDVINGKSETLINISLETLDMGLPLAINIHRSTQEFGIYTSCGEIK